MKIAVDAVQPLATLQGQLIAMGREAIRALPSIAIAVLIIVITWFVARFAASIADRLVGRTRLRTSLKELVETVVKLAIWLVGLMIALVVVMPGFTPASIFAGLGIGAVAIGFAFQDIFENFLAGVLIMLREKMRIGDVIECQGILGKVEHIALRETHIRSMSNELTIVPNSILFKNPVKILTDETRRRVQLTVGVSYDTDLDTAAAAITRAVEGIEGLDKDKGVEVYAKEFGASSVDFLVRWWAAAAPRDVWISTDRAVRAIKRALDAEGIEIPFPYVTNTFKEPVRVARDDDLSQAAATDMSPPGAPVAQQDRASDS